MTTTVPQNIKGSNIAGRHTPTRSSLRHSRMIVVNKNYQGKIHFSAGAYGEEEGLNLPPPLPPSEN